MPLYPKFKRLPNNQLSLYDSKESKLVKKSIAEARRRGPLTPLGPSKILETALKAVLKRKGNPKADRKDLLGEYTIDFGCYQGQTFRWILEEAPGYAGFLINGMEGEQKPSSPYELNRYENKMSLKEYTEMFPEGQEIIALKRKGASKSGSQPKKTAGGTAKSSPTLDDESLVAEVMELESKLNLDSSQQIKVCKVATVPETTADSSAAVHAKPKDIGYSHLGKSTTTTEVFTTVAIEQTTTAATKELKVFPPDHQETRTEAGTSQQNPQADSDLCLYAGWRKTIPKCDQHWVSKAFFKYTKSGKPELDIGRIDKLWWYPQEPSLIPNVKPGVDRYFSRPLCFWMPMKLWRVTLRCPHAECEGTVLTSAGVHQKTRQVVDVDGYYNIAAEYLMCKRCKRKMISWSHNLISQLDIGHRIQFPCILTSKFACDMRVIRLLRQRGLGNSSSQIQRKLEEQHSEVWLQQTIRYLSDCKGFASASTTGLLVPQSFDEPPSMAVVPKHRWLMQVYVLDVLQRLDEIKAGITSLFGRVLKMDSTKKVVKKLAGRSAKTAMWATNIGNEYGQVIMSVLTAGEGYGLSRMVTGIIDRYSNAGMPPPEILYVDRDCCEPSPVRRMFSGWENLQIRLDIWHFMRRLAVGCTTESHQLYSLFMGRLSHCIFKWDQKDLEALKAAKRAEMESLHINNPSEQDVLKKITRSELALHCKRTTRGVEETTALVSQLIQSFDSEQGRDTLGVPLINSQKMQEIWRVQMKHVACIQDPEGTQLYIQTGPRQKGGVELPTFRCARGSTSLECFHLHLNRFIPGSLASDIHFQGFLLDGLSRWNQDRGASAVSNTSSEPQTYSGLLRFHANSLGEGVLGKKFHPSYKTPGKYTGELIGVEYLFNQTGSVLQDYASGIDQMQTEASLPEETEQVEEDEGFDETDDFLDFTIPTLENQPASESSAPTQERPNILPILSEAEYRSMAEETLNPVTGDSDIPLNQPEKKEDETEDESVGPDNIPGYQNVQKLAHFLVTLKEGPSGHALTNEQASDIIKLWHGLSDYDRQPTVFSSRHKEDKKGGRFKATKKSVTEGVESTRRNFLGPNTGPAQWPDCNRYVEATISRLCDIFPSNRRSSGGRMETRWSLIARAYSHIRQCILDNARVMDETNLQFPPINNVTLTQWFNRRGKAQDKAVLAQGIPSVVSELTSKESLPAPLTKPDSLPSGKGEFHQFPSLPNTAGSAKLKRKYVSPATVATTVAQSTSMSATTHITAVPTAVTQNSAVSTMVTQSTPTAQFLPLASSLPTVFGAPRCPIFMNQPAAPGFTIVQPGAMLEPVKDVPYTTQYYRKRKLEKEQEGIILRKYVKKTNIVICRKCNSERDPSSHKQYFGNSYCQATETASFEEWKESLKAKGYGRKKTASAKTPDVTD